MNQSSAIDCSIPDVTPEVTDIFTILKYLEDAIWILVIILELLTVIFFVVQFSKRNSYFRTSYYIMLAIGLSVDIFCMAVTMRHYFIANKDVSDFWAYIEYSSSYYLAIYSDVWNITLILNRCTAIWFTFYSSRIWGITGTIIAILINFISPYAVIGFMLFQPECVLDKPCSTCDPSILPATVVTIASFTVATATVMILAVIICSKRKVQTFSEKSAAIEKRLIFQSNLCLILLAVYHLLRSSMLFLDTLGLGSPILLKSMETVAMFSYILQHFLEIFVLFVVSPTFRTAILKFYTFGRYKFSRTVTQVTILNRVYK